MKLAGILLFVGLVINLNFEYVYTDDDTFVSAEHKLISTILDPDKYDPIVRPAKKFDDVVKVTLDATVVTIENIEEKQGTMNTNGWLHQTWTDFRLKWEPGAYDGLYLIRIPIDRLWKPEIVLYNTAHQNPSYVQGDLAIVHSSGQVDWAPHGRFSTFCSLKLAMFPYDKQSCSLLFGTWTYDNSTMAYSLPKNDTGTNFVYPGVEWSILSVEPYLHQWPHGQSSRYNKDSVSEPKIRYFSMVEVRVNVKRIPTYYKHMMVFPSVVLALLTMFMLWVPPETGERITMGVGIMVTITLQLLILDSYLPTEIGEVPSILLFLTFDLVLVVFTMLESILILNFYHRDIRRGKVPTWARRIFINRLGRLVCMKGDVYSSLPSGETLDDDNANAGSMVDRELAESTEQPLPRSPTMALEKTLDEIRRFLKLMVTRPSTGQQYAVPSHRQMVANEWHHLALVLDRIFFWIFLVLGILLSLIIYCR